MADYKALLSGYSWHSAPTLKGKASPIILTYSFPKAMTWTEKFLYPLSKWKAFNEADRSAARYALKQWGDACGIRFIETKNGKAEIRFSWLENFSSDTVAFAEFPELETPFGHRKGEAFERGLFAGNVRVNPAFRGELDGNSSYKTFVLLHEIGHALGLKHPFHKMKYNKQLLDSSLDNTSHTVMSYNDGSIPYPTKLGALDIEAIRSLYGASSRDGRHLAGWKWSKAKQTLTQVGKDGADKIHGTAVKDVIKSRKGADKVFGYDGNDTLHGGAGNDVLSGGDGADRFVFDTALNPWRNVDKIADFDDSDELALRSWVFPGLPKGRLSDAFFSGTGIAEDEDDRIIYDHGTGYLFYDPDGTGPAEQIPFARLHRDGDPGLFDVAIGPSYILVV